MTYTTADPTITGPCQVQATFACAGTGFVRLNPIAMLPGATVTAYAPCCQACYDSLADLYVAQVNGR